MILRQSEKLAKDLKFWRASIKLLTNEEKSIANNLVQNVINAVDKIDQLHVPSANGVTPPSLVKDTREELVAARLAVKKYLDERLKARKRLRLR